MRGTHNPKWGIINIVCITTAVICVGVTVLGNFHNGAIVTSEVFLGVIGSLIGACATIIVGFQIFNYFEFKDVKSKTMKIEQLLNQASANNYKQEVLIRKSNNYLSNVFILLSREMKDADKINMYISSIVLIGIGDKDYSSTICPDDYDTSVLEERYKYIQNILLGIEINNLDAKANERAIETIRRPHFWDQFKQISYKNTLKRFNELIYLHFDVVNRIEKLIDATSNE